MTAARNVRIDNFRMIGSGGFVADEPFAGGALHAPDFIVV